MARAAISACAMGAAGGSCGEDGSGTEVGSLLDVEPGHELVAPPFVCSHKIVLTVCTNHMEFKRPSLQS